MAKQVDKFPGRKSFKKDTIPPPPGRVKVEIPDSECIRAIKWCEERAYILEDVPMMLAEYVQERDQTFIRDIIQVKSLAEKILLALLSNPECYCHPYSYKNLISKAHDIAKTFLRHNHQTF